MFRQHIIALTTTILSQWVHEAGIPKDRIFSAQGFIAPDPGAVAVRAAHRRAADKNYDTGGRVGRRLDPARRPSGRGPLWRHGGEPDARWRAPHNLFATFARMDPGWAVVESNATDLKQAAGAADLRAVVSRISRHVQLRRADSLADGLERIERPVRGSAGLRALYRVAQHARGGRRCATSWSRTRICLAARACGSSARPVYPDDDGWRLDPGKVYARGSYLDLEFADARATLLSPPDQVIRTAATDALVLGLHDSARLASAQTFGRVDETSPWIAIGAPVVATDMKHVDAGIQVPLAWPDSLLAKDTIVAELKIVLTFDKARRARAWIGLPSTLASTSRAEGTSSIGWRRAESARRDDSHAAPRAAMPVSGTAKTPQYNGRSHGDSSERAPPRHADRRSRLRGAVGICLP